MGWDAHSSAPLAKSKGVTLKHKKHREAFEQASKNVIEIAGQVDGLLSVGSLDCSDCYRMLRKAAETSKEKLNWGLAWGDDGMSPEVVKVMNMYLNWNFKYSKDDRWAYWSAREFVRVCNEQGLGIRFA